MSYNRNWRPRLKKWKALDSDMSHPVSKCHDHNDTQSGKQVNKTVQVNEESVKVFDSEDVTISTTDTKTALSIQAGIQAAIVILITITIGDSAKAEKITQELIQTAKTKQVSHQDIHVENSRQVTVESTDTQLAINIQLLLQLLLAVAVVIDIF